MSPLEAVTHSATEALPPLLPVPHPTVPLIPTYPSVTPWPEEPLGVPQCVRKAPPFLQARIPDFKRILEK